METSDAQVVALIPSKLKEWLVFNAQANGRSLSGEIRFALFQHKKLVTSYD